MVVVGCVDTKDCEHVGDTKVPWGVVMTSPAAQRAHAKRQEKKKQQQQRCSLWTETLCVHLMQRPFMVPTVRYDSYNVVFGGWRGGKATHLPS